MNENKTVIMRNSIELLKKLKIELAYDLAIPIIGYVPKGNEIVSKR